MRDHQPAMPRPIPDPKRLVPPIQLVDLQPHGTRPPVLVQRLAAPRRPSACPFHRRRGTGPNLARPARRGDAVSHPRSPNSCPNRRTDKKLPQHCVSHPSPLFFRRFFHHHNDFQPHCVSCRRPVQSRCRAPRRLTPQPPPQPVLPLVARIPAVPRPARTPVALALTTRRGADALAGPWVGAREEPAPADPTRTSASHSPPPRNRERDP